MMRGDGILSVLSCTGIPYLSDYWSCAVMFAGIFFFFQAEDGIRDVAVTGVQTCALPISGLDALVLDQRVQRHGGAVDAQVGAREDLVHRLAELFRDLREAVGDGAGAILGGSEERRVGEEGRSRWAPDH